LAPISFAAWLNALRAEPSLSVSNYLLVAAGLVLAATAFATRSEGTGFFFAYWRVQGTLAGAIIAVLYLNWIFACGLTWWRYRAST